MTWEAFMPQDPSMQRIASVVDRVRDSRECPDCGAPTIVNAREEEIKNATIVVVSAACADGCGTPSTRQGSPAPNARP